MSDDNDCELEVTKLGTVDEVVVALEIVRLINKLSDRDDLNIVHNDWWEVSVGPRFWRATTLIDALRKAAGE